MSEELKPCPFCGEAAEIDTEQGYRNISSGRLESQCAVYCTSCAAEQIFCYADWNHPRDEMPDYVRELWNRRAPSLEVTALVEAARKMRDWWNDEESPTIDECLVELGSALAPFTEKGK